MSQPSGMAALLLIAAASGAAFADEITHSNPHPDLQMYSYPASSANGAGAVRDRAPTFGSFSGVDSVTGESYFFPGSGTSPARRGSFIIASDTSDDVPLGLDPARYQIESIRVTTTLLGNLIYEPLNYVLPYDNTLDESAALTTSGGDMDAGRPIEMYGIGLQGDYDTINFDPVSSDDSALQLGDVRWRPYEEGEAGYDPELAPEEQPTAPYQFFALDALGRDAENAVAGGYSATEPTGETAQFTPDPFAIGKLYHDNGEEFSPGDLMNNGDRFVFEPDLQHEGIIDYLQQSLSEGWVGFSFSSLHEPSGHEGTVPYPDFYLDDLDVGNNPDGAAPTIELVVTVLDPLLPGDFDASGVVDQADLAVWRYQFGGEGPEADGNGDGVVNAADYTLWRNHSADSETGVAVPEPSTGQIVAIAVATVLFCVWQRWFVCPRRLS